jgi:precorrin-2/cobalt-factor-2 C20-methyltransferase
MGKLYGLGVGPGDPELITLKAVRILKTVDTVFAASSAKNEYSLALRIVEPHISEKTSVKLLPFPMSQDRAVLEEAWKDNAIKVIAELRQGRDAAFITIGDPMIYSTCGYLIREIQKQSPESVIETVPGITSYQAAAAASNISLVEGKESLLIVSGTNGGPGISMALGVAENIVLLKAYRNFEEIYGAINELGLVDQAIGVAGCGLPGEEIVTDIRKMRGKEHQYLTLLIVKKKRAGTEAL